MNTATTHGLLSPGRQRLVRVMQEINFGYIQDLTVRDGHPVFEPAPKIFYDLKIGGDNGPRPELASADFPLRQQVIELFDHLGRIQNGTIECIEVKHGLPFKLLFEKVAA